MQLSEKQILEIAAIDNSVEEIDAIGKEVVFESTEEYRAKIAKAGTVVFLVGAICGVGIAATIANVRGTRKIKK